MEGEPKDREEMEIPLKLVIVGDAMCRTETTSLWRQAHSRKDVFSDPPSSCALSQNPSVPKGPLFSGTCKGLGCLPFHQPVPLV